MRARLRRGHAPRTPVCTDCPFRPWLRSVKSPLSRESRTANARLPPRSVFPIPSRTLPIARNPGNQGQRENIGHRYAKIAVCLYLTQATAFKRSAEPYPSNTVRFGQRETDNQTCGRTPLAAGLPSNPGNPPKRPALTPVLWQPKRSNRGARHSFPGFPFCKVDPRQIVQTPSGNTALEPFRNQCLAAILRIGHVRCFFHAR